MTSRQQYAYELYEQVGSLLMEYFAECSDRSIRPRNYFRRPGIRPLEALQGQLRRELDSMANQSLKVWHRAGMPAGR